MYIQFDHPVPLTNREGTQYLVPISNSQVVLQPVQPMNTRRNKDAAKGQGQTGGTVKLGSAVMACAGLAAAGACIGSAFADGMFSGDMGDMGDNLKSLVDGARGAGGAVNEMMNSEAAGEVGEVLGDAGEFIGEGLGDGAKSLVDGAKGAGGAVNEMMNSEAAGEVGEVLGNAGEFIGEGLGDGARLAEGFAGQIDSTSILSGFFNTVENFGKTVSDFF